MSRARAFLARRADHAGGSTGPWLIVTVLASIELIGTMPVTARWPAQAPTITRGVIAANRFAWRHAGRLVSPFGDPLGAWVTDIHPEGSRWLGVAAVPLFIALMLAIVREHRATTLPARALRLVAAGLAYLVVALYLRHLLVSLFNPVEIGLLSVHLALLAPIVAGIALLVRSIVGSPAPAGSIGRHTAGGRLRAGLVLLLTTCLGVLLVGTLPMPS